MWKFILHLLLKPLHASFVHNHFHLRNAADVIIAQVAIPLLHQLPSLQLSPYRKLPVMTIHLHPLLLDLWPLQIGLQSELLQLIFLQKSTQSHALPNSVQIIPVYQLHTKLPHLKLINPLQLPSSEEIPSLLQPLQNRVQNPKSPLCQTLSIPTSIQVPQMTQILPRTNPSTRHQFSHKFTIHFSSQKLRFQNSNPSILWKSKPEYSCPKLVTIPYLHLSFIATSSTIIFTSSTPKNWSLRNNTEHCASLDLQTSAKAQPLKA